MTAAWLPDPRVWRPLHVDDRSGSVGWVYVTSPHRPDYEATGKFLFFSDDPVLLLMVAWEQIHGNGFHRAKIAEPPVGDYVLCLYWADASRLDELRTLYPAERGFWLMGWKSNADTRAGRYSRRFIRARDAASA